MGLGGYPAIGLAKARELAGDCRSVLAAGFDPIAARNEKRAAAAVEAAKAMTFADCATAYFNAHEAGWRNPKHRQQWKNTLATYVSPVVGKLPVSAADTGLVLKVLEPIWTRKPETASRVRGRMEAVLDWAKARGYRTGENPARWRGPLPRARPGPDGAGPSPICCPPRPRCGRSSIPRHYRMPGSVPSWPRCESRTAFPPAPSNFSSLPPLARARRWVQPGTKSIWGRSFGPSRPIA